LNNHGLVIVPPTAALKAANANSGAVWANPMFMKAFAEHICTNV
jgi:hypothetical protein